MTGKKGRSGRKNLDGQKECGAQLRKRPGQFCRVKVTNSENGRCRLHGGNGKSGAPIKHGRYSKGFKKSQEMYLEALNDPDIMRLEPTLALFDTHINRLAKAADENDCPEYRRKLKAVWKKLTVARDENDAAAFGEAYEEIGQLIERGWREMSSWETLLRTAERRSARTEAALNTMIRGQEALSRRDLVVLVTAIFHMILDHVEDKTLAMGLVRRINSELLGNAVQQQE